MTAVAGRLLGLSDDQAAQCLDITDVLVRAVPGEPVAQPTPQERLPALFVPVMAARRQAPGDDLISALVAVGADGSDALTDAEIFAFVVGVFVPLLGPSPNAIGNGIALLGEHADQRADLVGNPGAVNTLRQWLTTWYEREEREEERRARSTARAKPRPPTPRPPPGTTFTCAANRRPPPRSKGGARRSPT